MSALGSALCQGGRCVDLLDLHRVSEDDEGDMQCLKPGWLDHKVAYLTPHYDVIALRKLVECFE
jgi:hypothetical protein